MHNLIKDKYNILGLIGSFYTNQMNSQASKQAGRITYVPFQTNITSKINQIIQYLSGNCYSVADYLVIPISETVIEYGVLGENQDVRSIEYKNFYKTYINNLELQKNQRIIYKINFNEDIYATALQLEEDASLLFEGVDFTSEFGCIYTYNTPSSIFGDSIHIRKYIQKKVNSNNYRLGVQDVYGDTNFIADFYRNNQSLKAFKYALLQAAGFPIIQEDDYIKNKLRTKNGCVYVTSNGKFYTADFKHNELSINTPVTKNQYIGSEILSIILPEDPIPSNVQYVNFNGGSVTGNKDIVISNSTKTLFNDNIFIAENFAQGGAGKQAYLNYINQLGAAEKPSASVPDSMNCIDFLRNVVAADRCLIIQIDEEKLTYDMTMKLKSFIIDNAPIGSVIAYCNGEIPVDPPVDPEPEPEPLPELIRLRTNIDMSAPEDKIDYLDDGTTLISSLNLNSSKGFTLMLTMNWTSVTDAPLIWFNHNQGNYTHGNAMAFLGYTKGFKHNSMYNAYGSNVDTTDLYPITNANKDNVPDYIDAANPSNNQSLAGKTLVYFIEIKEKAGNGRAVLYELMNDKTVQAIAECYNSQTNVLSRGTLGKIVCSNWKSGSANAGFVTVDAYDGILTQEEMTRLANNISQ